MKILSTIFVVVSLAHSAFAQSHQSMSVSAPMDNHSVAAELKSFEVAEGYEVSLFADETDGIANPIAMRWDSRGRLWVLCSLVYPQIVPTEKADDQLFILEDIDGDGRADRSIIFARGLDMPTGFALGEGGVFIGEGQNLIFLRDINGDDRADERTELFSGFGTGDTHQNINSFAWSPDGELLFCQGLHCFSRVETPWGIERLNEHGVWRLRPRRKQFHAYRGGSGQNPWGISYGQWGEPFVKGNNSELSELLPVMVATDRLHRPLDIGRTQIKSMICEIVDSPALPKDLQGDVLIAGYFGHLVDRLDMSIDGSGHKGVLQDPLIRTGHSSFRPVDIRTGPDGALYVADWYNPIIGHYQASLRHPNRDKVHGRIWRVSAKGHARLPVTDLTTRSIPQLLQRLAPTFLSERKRIRTELSSRDRKEVIAALDAWVPQLKTDRERFEALAVYGWQEAVNVDLLDQALKAKEPGLRGYATRMVGRWHDRMEGALERVQKSVNDGHPRVRLEAVVAASYLPDVGAMAVAAQALDHSTDRFISAALMQAAHATHATWWPALQAGRSDFENPVHLAFVLKQTGGKDAAGTVRQLLAQPELDAQAAENLMVLLVNIGGPADLRWVWEQSSNSPAVLDALVLAQRVRGIKPPGEWSGELLELMKGKDLVLRVRAIELAGVWEVDRLGDSIRAVFTDTQAPAELRKAAVASLASLQGKAALDVYGEAVNDPALRRVGFEAFCLVDLAQAATVASQILRTNSDAQTVQDVVTPFLGLDAGASMLAKGLGADPIDPALATHIRSVLGAAGRYDSTLDRVLGLAAGDQAIGMPEYSEAFVHALAEEVKQNGIASRGASVYASPGLSCVACHKMGDTGGVLGPELTAVGAGVPVELMIEAVLWPRRQIKEGYTATSITTKDSKTISGYVDAEDKQHLSIRDAATGVLQTVPSRAIAKREDAGTLMPPGLTAGLTRGELRDLIRYLSEQRGH